MASPKPKPGYYAILTADVRYDKDLLPNTKLLYAEITALSDRSGYCFAGNQYFADLYNVKPGTVSGWISLLVEKGYLHREVIRDPTTREVISRKLRLKDATPPPSQAGDPSPINIGDPPPKISKENTTSINNKTLPSEEETVPKKPTKAKQAVDERSEHPAIQAMREVTSKFPKKPVYDLLIEAIGDNPDVDRLKDCFARWCLKGWNPENLTWATEWYAQPDPEPEPPKQSGLYNPDGTLRPRLDYPWLMMSQAQWSPEEFADRKRYEEAKDGWLEIYKARGEDVYELSLAEVAEYESSNDFKRRFNETA